METPTLSTQVKVRQCSQCQGDTEFYCNTCKRDLCLQCKERHVIDLDTIHHGVVIYREKFKNVIIKEDCVRHPNRQYIKFCHQCKYSVCNRCGEHRTHELKDLRTIYRTKRQQHREIIDNIRGDALYKCHILLAGIQANIQTCPSQIYYRQSQMSTKSQGLKDLIDTLVHNSKIRNRLLEQKRNMDRYLLAMQNVVHKYEQSANRAVQFLSVIKDSIVPQIKDTPIISTHVLMCIAEGFNMDGVRLLLKGIPKIQMTTGKRRIRIHDYVKLMSTPAKHMSICVKDVSRVSHISGVTSGQVWVSDGDNIILTDTTGDTIHHVTDITPWTGVGLHTVNNSGELIYIDSNNNINTLATEKRTATTLLETSLPWVPLCLYCSKLTGELIVGMFNADTNTGRIAKYNSIGQHARTIQRDNERHILYRNPRYITENKNGDIIVSDSLSHSVVITDREGRYRFSYKGYPSGSSMDPMGICTDALSHILVCDNNTYTVQMIDKDSHFLSLLLTRQHGINIPLSLNYDDKTQLLWVGSRYKSTLSVYRYIQRGYSQTEQLVPNSTQFNAQQSQITKTEKFKNLEQIWKSENSLS